MHIELQKKQKCHRLVKHATTVGPPGLRIENVDQRISHLHTQHRSSQLRRFKHKLVPTPMATPRTNSRATTPGHCASVTMPTCTEYAGTTLP